MSAEDDNGKPPVSLRVKLEEAQAQVEEAQAAAAQKRYEGRLVDIEAELARPDVPTKWRVENVAEDGTSTIVGGKGGSGKSWLQQSWAHGVTLGSSIAGFKCIKGPAILFDAEMGRRMYVKRIRSSGLGRHVKLYDATGIDLDKPADQAWMLAEIKRHIDPEVGGFVGIDSLRRLTPSLRENESDDMSAILGVIADMARETGAAIVTNAHQGWEGSRVRGSSTILDQCDAMFSFGQVSADKDPTGELRKLTCRGAGLKMRVDREPEDRYVVIGQNGGIEEASRPSDAKRLEYAEAILAALPQTTKTAAALLCGTTAQNKTWLAEWSRLEAVGDIAKVDGEWVKTEPQI